MIKREAIAEAGKAAVRGESGNIGCVYGHRACLESKRFCRGRSTLYNKGRKTRTIRTPRLRTCTPRTKEVFLRAFVFKKINKY